MGEIPIDLEAEIAALYRGPLRTFVTDRNSLVKDLRAAGRKEDARRVRDLSKPNLTAWVLNQLHWIHRKDLERLMELGDRLRDLQSGRLSREEARLIPKQRQAHLSRLLLKARGLLEQGGHAKASDTQRKLAASLDALSSWGRNYPGRLGFLNDEILPPDLEDLLALAGSAPRRSGRVASKPGPPARDVERERRIRMLKDSLASLAKQEEMLGAQLNASVEERDAARESVQVATRALSDARAALSQAEQTLLAGEGKLANLRKDLEQKEKELAALDTGGRA